jgi:hypothetical protein
MGERGRWNEADGTRQTARWWGTAVGSGLVSIHGLSETTVVQTCGSETCFLLVIFRVFFFLLAPFVGRLSMSCCVFQLTSRKVEMSDSGQWVTSRKVKRSVLSSQEASPLVEYTLGNVKGADVSSLPCPYRAVSAIV